MRQKSQDIIQFAIIYTISRLFCLFIPGQLYDFYEDATWGNALIHLENIYQAFGVASQGAAILKYPPLYYPLLSIMLLAFGYYSWSIRIWFTCWEVGILVVLYHFSGAINQNRLNKGQKGSQINQINVLYVYAFSPITIINLILGQPWSLGVFFSLLGTYTFYQHKPKLTGLIFCLGFLTQLYPAFVLFPVIIFYMSKKRWKELWKLTITFAISFVVFCLPFFFLDPELFLFNFFTHLSRIPQTATLWTLLENSNVLPLSIFGILNISPLGLISVGFTLFFMVISFVYFKRHQETNEENVLWAAIIYYMFLPLIFLTLDFRYCYWVFPLLSILLVNEVTPKKRLAMGLIGIGLTLSMGLLFAFTMPDLLVINQSIYYGMDTIVAILTLTMLFSLISQPIFASLWLYFGKTLRINKTENETLNLHQTLTLTSTIFVFQFGAVFLPSTEIL